MAVWNLCLYHGTSSQYSGLIKSSGFKIQPSRREDDWLGSGVYFFREDEAQAMVFALFHLPSAQELHVLEIILSVFDYNYLNLDTREGITLYEDFCKQKQEKIESAGIKLSATSPEELRHMFMNLLPDTYKAIQYTFTTPSKFDRSPILQYSDLRMHGVQVCIRDESLISDHNKIIITKTHVR